MSQFISTFLQRARAVTKEIAFIESSSCNRIDWFSFMQRQLRSSNVNLPSVWNLDQHQANADAFIAAMANDDDTASAAIAVPVVVWKTNPLHGDFNPGTLAGSKIFLQKTKVFRSLRGFLSRNRRQLKSSNTSKPVKPILEVLWFDPYHPSSIRMAQ